MVQWVARPIVIS